MQGPHLDLFRFVDNTVAQNHTWNTAHYIFFRFIQFGGMTGILAGMMVAFKQIKSEQELIGSLGLRIKVGLMEQSDGCTLYLCSNGPFSCLFIFHWVKIP